MGIITRTIAALIAVISVLWLFFQPGWEALVTSLGSISALITFALADEFKVSQQSKLDRSESDKKQLAKLFLAFPYDQSAAEIDNADHSGVSKGFMKSLDILLNFRNTPYQLRNKKVECKRKLFLESAAKFYEVLLKFVGWDDKHQRLIPPYHLKGGANESIYREMQRDVTVNAKAIISAYDALIAEAKICDVYPDH